MSRQSDTKAPTVTDIEAAHRTIVKKLPPTPLLFAHELTDSLGGAVYLKCELFQPTGSFKPRGALNWMANATEAELAAGLVTVSAGNHATGLAWAAQATEVPVTVVMPKNASPMKAHVAHALGATVEWVGDINDAWRHAHRLVDAGLTLVAPYDEPRIIAGAGTVGLELVAQWPVAPDVVVCGVGGGGLVSGIGLALKHAHPGIRLVGVEPAGAPTLARSWQTGIPVTLDTIETIATSLGANRAGRWTHEISRQVVDELVQLDEADIKAGTLSALAEARLYAEPGGAIAIAALLNGRVSIAEGETAIAVVSGGNMDLAWLKALL